MCFFRSNFFISNLLSYTTIETLVFIFSGKICSQFYIWFYIEEKRKKNFGELFLFSAFPLQVAFLSLSTLGARKVCREKEVLYPISPLSNHFKNECFLMWEKANISNFKFFSLFVSVLTTCLAWMHFKMQFSLIKFWWALANLKKTRLNFRVNKFFNAKFW